ncbi:hypothetical protein ACEN88_36495, partial [Massilia sp. CT11-108]|uniref:hypothetical protein n=1 Tax=Massilia sp. CT11-108 TaxID=3393900 RepID=UPI0039A5680F
CGSCAKGRARSPVSIPSTRPATRAGSADYPLLADGAHAGAYEIHSVDAVRLVREGTGTVTRFDPLYAPGDEGR